MNEDESVADNLGSDPTGRKVPEPFDILSDPKVRERFEQTVAALEVADLVRKMRQNAPSPGGTKGISQEELARRTNLSQPRISQIEKGGGRDGLTYAVIRRIAHACGIDWGGLIRLAVSGNDPSKDANNPTAPTVFREATYVMPTGELIDNLTMVYRDGTVIVAAGGLPNFWHSAEPSKWPLSEVCDVTWCSSQISSTGATLLVPIGSPLQSALERSKP